jgi:multisubunit Na+/H+ antiporter MnhC subunit
MTAYLLCILLFCLGVYCVLAKRNLIKIIVGVIIAECAVNLMFILVAYRADAAPPIAPPSASAAWPPMVDPLPHALVLTAIVIGLATTALMAAIAMRIYQKYGTYDIDEIRELRG